MLTSHYSFKTRRLQSCLRQIFIPCMRVRYLNPTHELPWYSVNPRRPKGSPSTSEHVPSSTLNPRQGCPFPSILLKLCACAGGRDVRGYWTGLHRRALRATGCVWETTWWDMQWSRRAAVHTAKGDPAERHSQTKCTLGSSCVLLDTARTRACFLCRKEKPYTRHFQPYRNTVGEKASHTNMSAKEKNT